jgi:tRNA threonylcarbamoyl adenosine modification protein YjeE
VPVRGDAAEVDQVAPGDHILPDPAEFTHQKQVSGAGETLDLGRRLASLLQGGETVLLHGDLGAGKTCLVQGICAELQTDGEVVSPTFTLVNTYVGRLTVHHLDFYRVEPGQDLTDIGVPEILDEIWDGQAVGLIEWPGPLVPELGAGPRFELMAVVGDQPDQRTWYLRAKPEVPAAWREIFPPKGNPAC